MYRRNGRKHQRTPMRCCACWTQGYLSPGKAKASSRGTRTATSWALRLLYALLPARWPRLPRRGRGPAIVVPSRSCGTAWSESPHCVDLFHSRGKVGMMLQHPKIVRTLAVSQDADSKQYYMVMEFVEGSNPPRLPGHSQENIAHRGAVESSKMLPHGLAYAFTYNYPPRHQAHQRAHRCQGRPPVTDFGLASIYSSMMMRTTPRWNHRRLCRPGEGHQRPLRRHAQRHLLLGCMMYEMLSGRPPLAATKD